MNLKDIRRHLPPSPATPKGRMKKPKGGIRSTRKDELKRAAKEAKEALEMDEDMHPKHKDKTSEGEKVNNIFCFAALAEKESGTVYTDATGALPVMSVDGQQYYVVVYDYDTNYIDAVAVEDLKDETIVATIQKCFEQMEENGLNPRLNITDNQAVRPLKAFLKTKDCNWQFVEPHNHRVNAAERAIQTFKNHLISGMSCTDSEWPLQLWHKLTEQALITLNLCRTSRKEQQKSAYHSYHGHRYDWNKNPMAPPGTRAVVYLPVVGRPSWGPQGIDAWYCGPAMDHYRNMIFFVPETQAYHTSASFDLFPQHCQLPTLSEQQHNETVATEWLESLQR